MLHTHDPSTHDLSVAPTEIPQLQRLVGAFFAAESADDRLIAAGVLAGWLQAHLGDPPFGYQTGSDRSASDVRTVWSARTGPAADKRVIADLVEGVRGGKRLPSKSRLMQDQGIGSGRANRLLNAAAARIGRPLQQLQETSTPVRTSYTVTPDPCRRRHG